LALIVLDASAAVELTTRSARAQSVAEAIAQSDAGSVHAPHLIDLEVAQVLRGLVLRRALTAPEAAEALDDFLSLRIERYPHRQLLTRVWELRENLTSYDASYVALAEALDADLLTADERLSHAPGRAARVIVV
jgi:predicted nucleic acid-binding protein